MTASYENGSRSWHFCGAQFVWIWCVYLPMRHLAIVLIWSMLAAAPLAWADSLDRARQLIRSGQPDVAFLTFRALAREQPNTVRGRQALFAVAEYYVNIHDRSDAARALDEIERLYPDTTEAVLAAVYRYAIAAGLTVATSSALQPLRRELFSAPLVLLFSTGKDIQYRSLWGHRYIIRRSLNRLEVLKNGEPFIRLTR